MLVDSYNQPVSTRSAEAVEALNQFMVELISHGKGAAAILTAVDLAPDWALAQAYAGALFLFLQTREGGDRAAPYLVAARRCQSTALPRESAIIDAILTWAAGDLWGAVERHGRIAQQWPQDVVNLKLAQIHQISLGDVDHMVELLEPAMPKAAESGYALGLLAYAYEQQGRLDTSLVAARRAVEINPHDGWAHHAIAHVYDTQGNIDQGIAWLDANNHHWDRCSSFMYTHNWWHLALFHIDAGSPASALALYDQRVWGVRKGHVQDQLNAISLLARLEFRGIDIGDRWTDIAEYAAPRTAEHLNGFYDLHVIYALARAGKYDLVDLMLGNMRRFALAAPGRIGRLWREVVVPAAAAVVRHSQGNWRDCALIFRRVQSRLIEAGGSHAQRDLFEQMQLDALMKAAFADEAAQLLKQRVRQRPAIQWQRRELQRLQVRDDSHGLRLMHGADAFRQIGPA